MARRVQPRAWSKDSSTSESSTSDRSSSKSTRSVQSSHSQYTNITSYSETTKPVVKHHELLEDFEVFDEPDELDGDLEDPRASTLTYASTTPSEHQAESSPSSSFWPSMRSVCYEPEALATTPAEFGELFPSTRRILIQHDDTTPDGNLNLRVDTELAVSKGHKVKLTLFHLRMYDLAERQFSLRRYQRQSGREVCNSKRKYLKPAPEPSATPSRRRSLTSTLTKINLRNLKSRPRPKREPEVEEEEGSDEDVDLIASQAEVKATIPTDTIKIEFSNYAQVEFGRTKKVDGKYDFEYWGERYSWRRHVYRDEMDVVFSFELVDLSSGVCIAHITPDKLSQRQSRQEAAQGSWVPPCSMRLTDKGISNDLGDVIVVTGLLALVDDCIRRHWHEPHRS
jgi:NACalpha-BTF3-like transcription factor